MINQQSGKLLDKLPKITFWRVLFVITIACGAYSTWLRFFRGLGASTNLTDQFPWGLWIGFDVLCGVMLAAGGFTLMATVHIFNAKRFKPIARPALLTAFLGYLLVIAALMFDLGRPYRIWHPLVMWNPRSVMFEVGWCVTLYTSVLSLEFLPIVFERLRFEQPLRILRMISVPLFILGIILSTLHQSSLGSLYLIVPGKLHPLWYSPLLPVFFFLSAIAVGLAMTIFESTMSSRHFNHQLEKPLILDLGRILLVVLIVYALLRAQDLFRRDVLKFAFNTTQEASMFWVEVGLALIVPIILMLVRKIRENPMSLYVVSIMVVAGFLVNRLNVAVTGMERSAGVTYVPRWTEVAVTLSIVAAGIALFAAAVKYLPIFHEMPPARADRRVPPATAAPAQAG
ncbi:MAG TPA: Ni/Fe-hydrogenase cytochrome b subunit [Thermoanaerobaculia bacterium]|nr:Ni/Fe-hydrogenase cytochrome b subunit [Thermoanaerobaculia bacterium]